MRTPIATQVVGDLSTLPDSTGGARHLLWWANLGFMLIEGIAFALAAGAYLYLLSQSPAWPPAGDRPPDLLWSTIFTIGLVASEAMNRWVSKRADAKDGDGVRTGVLAMVVIGLVLCAARGFEFAHLNVHWTTDAYGSVVFLLMVLHTSHLVTDLGETATISLWLYTHSIGDDQYVDVADNANYWRFVILAWLPIYALLYWVPRWL